MKINYPAVLVAAVAHFMTGGVWYGGIFGNKFIELMGWTPAQLEQVANQSHTTQYLAAFIASLVLAYVLAYFIKLTRANSLVAGVQTAGWLWLGFVATTQFPTVVFEYRRLGLYLLNIGYQLVGCLIAGAILSLWRKGELAES